MVVETQDTNILTDLNCPWKAKITLLEILQGLKDMCRAHALKRNSFENISVLMPTFVKHIKLICTGFKLASFNAC